jgi:hypothetical protein
MSPADPVPVVMSSIFAPLRTEEMTFDTEDQKPKTEMIRYGEGDPFAAYGDAVSSRTGRFLKFSKGDYMAGEGNDLVAVGTKFVANVEELLAGWVRWEDGKAAEQIIGRVADRFRPPLREDLGHTEQSQWDAGSDGKPQDPWTFVNYLPLMDAAGEAYTFTTSSRGGLNAIGTLSRQFGRQRAKQADKLPLIQLAVDVYQHKSYGRIKTPNFPIIGWYPKQLFGVPPGEEGFTLPPAKDELSDDIPF